MELVQLIFELQRSATYVSMCVPSSARNEPKKFIQMVLGTKVDMDVPIARPQI